MHWCTTSVRKVRNTCLTTRIAQTEQDGVVGEAPEHHRFYGELAEWWPLISPPEDYAEESAFAATVLASASIPVREVLELGSGGGHSAVHLKAQFTMTLVDLSDEMLAVSRQLNPECEHHQGDMRTVRLGRASTPSSSTMRSTT